MELTEQQRDALTELINIAFSRTANALSELTERRVLIARPEVSVFDISELAEHLGRLGLDELASVHQVFTGPVGGDALLLLDQAGAAMLVDLLTAGQGATGLLSASAREVLTEVGNILLNACLGMFGDLLQVHFRFSVPRLYLDALEGLLQSLTVGQEELCYALVISTRLATEDGEVSGHLVIVLGVTSLAHLLQAVEEWEERLLEELA